MPSFRRAADRRRRVMYQFHVAPAEPSTPAERRAAEELRAARQPAQAFGSRVHQHLRGRWFSLVPVSNFAMTMTATVVLAVSVLLAFLNHIAMNWPSIAYRPELARPLSIDRPDSFAAWWIMVLLLLSAGACRLNYGLRSHRRDDYRGHYQLWQLTLVVLLLASVHATVDLVAWLGAGLDLIIGDRKVMSGANWLRIVLDVGGIVLAMRLVVEVYRCRPALAAMLCAGAWIGLAEAANWRLIEIQSPSAATLVIAAPMLGWSCFLLAATFYLRSMYRQIRNIPASPSLRSRLSQWMESRRQSDDDDGNLEFFHQQPELRKISKTVARPQGAAATPQQVSSPPAVLPKESPQLQPNDKTTRTDDAPQRSGWFSWFRRSPTSDATSPSSRPTVGTVPSGTVPSGTVPSGTVPSGTVQRPQPDAASAATDAIEKPRRRWFGLRSPKPAAETTALTAEKKPWFSLRLKPKSIGVNDLSAEPSPEKPRLNVGGTFPSQPSVSAPPSVANGTSQAVEPSETAVTKKPWFGSWRRKPAQQDEDPSGADEDPAPAGGDRPQRSGPLASRAKGLFGRVSRASQTPGNGPGDGPQHGSGDEADTEGGDLDPDGIDWESLNKSERRRMRKQLKRSGRAA